MSFRAKVDVVGGRFEQECSDFDQAHQYVLDKVIGLRDSTMEVTGYSVRLVQKRKKRTTKK